MMEIIEKDFKITHNGYCFVLHLLKSKKELKESQESPELKDLEDKEEKEDKFKIGGYYSFIDHAFSGANDFRNGKKYPFSESKTELKIQIQKYKLITNEFNRYLSVMNLPITLLAKKVLNGIRNI